jgi:hypothetical protein
MTSILEYEIHGSEIDYMLRKRLHDKPGNELWKRRIGKKSSNAPPLPKRPRSSSSASRTENTCHIRLLDGKKVFLKDQVLEAPNVEGRPYVSRKERRPDEWDPPVEQYDPMDRAPRTTSTSSRKRLRHDCYR